ncbi:MAG: carbohydrate kinase family protein [Armatimonadota bacterium]
MPDIVCLGEALVDMVATSRGLSLVQAPEFHKAAGGAPTNVAAGVAILGGSAGLIAQVGKDHFGEFIKQTLWDAGVDLSHFSQNPSYATQLAFIALDGGGVPDFAFHVKQSADQMLEPGQLDADYIREAQVFHLGSITMIADPARSATTAALEIALEEGLLISVDPNLRPPLWKSLEDAHDAITALVKVADFLKVSQEEMTFITGQDDLDAGIRALHAMGPELVAVTRGYEGCAIYNGRDYLEIPAFRVPVVDTTGCGDAFVAATLARVVDSDNDIGDMEAEELSDIFLFANAAAALAATAEGAIPSMPGLEEVQELLELGGIELPDEEEEDAE